MMKYLRVLIVVPDSLVILAFRICIFAAHLNQHILCKDVTHSQVIDTVYATL